MTTEDLIEFCRIVESVAPRHGAHVAMTGGCLYKDGERKDGDILLYRIRQTSLINLRTLFAELVAATDGDFKLTGGWGWCYKGTWRESDIDIFVPEEGLAIKPEFKGVRAIQDSRYA